MSGAELSPKREIKEMSDKRKSETIFIQEKKIKFHFGICDYTITQSQLLTNEINLKF